MGKTEDAACARCRSVGGVVYRISPVLQRKYIAALRALAKCEVGFIIATLRSDFYSHYQQFPELIKMDRRQGARSVPV
jgi:hypothetical protein